jgi:HTH-type transcriptional regulator/antitoxin HigA
LSDAKLPPPGERIKEELRARGWTQPDLAAILGRPYPTVNEIIAGKKAITPETAVQLGIAFGTGPELWMQLEASYRLSLVTGDKPDVAQRARLYALGPVKEMERRGWIKPTADRAELERELKVFFGVESLDKDPEINTVARKSSGGDALTPAQRAWCFRAKQLAGSVPAKPYDPKSLEPCVARLRVLAAYPEEVRKVPRVLAGAGIRLVVIEPLPKSRIDGVAFWLDPQSPVIALSLRFDRIDSFWHTLGHELAHIRHRDVTQVDTEIVGEDRPPSESRSEVEQRADREACETWIRSEDLEDFIRRVGPLYSKAKINQFANRIKIHPGIIVGQLQHRREISFASIRELLVKVRDKVTDEALTDGWGHTIGETSEEA